MNALDRLTLIICIGLMSGFGVYSCLSGARIAAAILLGVTAGIFADLLCQLLQK